MLRWKSDSRVAVLVSGTVSMAFHDGPDIAMERLSIRNFRGIEKLDLDFRGPDQSPNRLVVFAGPNGCGKTAILEAALIVLGGQKVAVGPIGRRAIRHGGSDYEISASIRERTRSGERVTERVAKSRSPIPQAPAVPFSYFSSWRAPNLVGSVNVTISRRGRRPAQTDANRLLNIKQRLANAAALEKFPGGQATLFPVYSDWIARINRAWTRFYSGQRNAFSVGLADTDAGDSDEGAFDVFHQAHDSTPKLPVDDLSAGQLELFLLIAELTTHDQHPGIVLIDEPELHLDPQWHAPIMRTLMSLQPRTQFLVSTHSPAIFNAAASHERHFLVPEDDPRAVIWRPSLTRS